MGGGCHTIDMDCLRCGQRLHFPSLESEHRINWQSKSRKKQLRDFPVLSLTFKGGYCLGNHSAADIRCVRLHGSSDNTVQARSLTGLK